MIHDFRLEDGYKNYKLEGYKTLTKVIKWGSRRGGGGVEGGGGIWGSTVELGG